jgi:hypothetical protein
MKCAKAIKKILGIDLKVTIYFLTETEERMQEKISKEKF